ncbi:hypothetical protein OQA88_8443 [Cercophora sp. LCS_1]
MSDYRGRSRRTYYDDDYYPSKPRHRSLGRQALDKLEDAMENLGLDSHRDSRAVAPYRDHHHHHHRRPSSHHSHHSHHTHSSRRHHSASPARTTHRGRHTRRDSRHGSSKERSRSRWGRGIEAAVDAAAIEAFRLRKEPGPWTGAKGGRIATAAVSAGVIGAASDRRKSDHGEGGRKGALGSALGGLVVNRLVHGPRKEVRY